MVDPSGTRASVDGAAIDDPSGVGRAGVRLPEMGACGMPTVSARKGLASLWMSGALVALGAMLSLPTKTP